MSPIASKADNTTQTERVDRSSAGPHAADGQGHDATQSISRLERLRAEFLANAARLPGQADASLTTLTKRAAGLWHSHGRAAKAAIGVLILVVVGWVPVRSLLATTSTEAVLNARLITLRAPIEGQVELVSVSLRVGDQLADKQSVLRVVNRRAERGRLDDLRRLIDQLESERDGVTTRITELSVLQNDLAGQVRHFQEGRVRQLTERAGELSSELAAAAASRDAAAKAMERVKPLADTGSVSAAVLERYTRDERVTAETYTAIEHRLAALQIELRAAELGTFLGDTYNDRPRSSQRVDEVGQRLAELTADLRERDARLFSLRKELAEETKRVTDNTSAELVAPTAGRVWEVLTSPGESVVRGQELIRVLDCTGVIVTAAVSESVYNRLHIGQSTTFQLRGETATYPGRIVGLTGVASAPANLAIQPNALAKELYRVSVAVSEFTAKTECRVGRTGRVTFGE